MNDYDLKFAYSMAKLTAAFATDNKKLFKCQLQYSHVLVSY